MKVHFDKQKLLAAITPAAGISQTKNTLVSVDGLLFECPPDPKYGEYDTDRDDLCRISAFDLEKGLRTSVECEIEERGMYIINTVKILQIIRAMPDGRVTIEVDDQCRVRITGGQSSFDITCSPGNEFPTMPMFIGEKIYTLPQYLLRELLSQTVYAIAVNDQRLAAINGALFRIRDDQLMVVSTDTRRVAVAKCALPEGSPDAEVVIPGKFLGELMKLLHDTEDEVTMMVGRKHVIFKIDQIYFFTRMIEAEFLDFERPLRMVYRTEVSVRSRDLLSAIERASIVTEYKLGGTGSSPIKIEIADNSISLSSVSTGGSVFERVPAAVNGADISIGFNCRYLLEALRAVPGDCETLRLRLNAPLLGMLVESAHGTFNYASPDDSALTYSSDTSDGADSGKKGDDERQSTDFINLILPVRLNK